MSVNQKIQSISVHFVELKTYIKAVQKINHKRFNLICPKLQRRMCLKNLLVCRNTIMFIRTLFPFNSAREKLPSAKFVKCLSHRSLQIRIVDIVMERKLTVKRLPRQSSENADGHVRFLARWKNNGTRCCADKTQDNWAMWMCRFASRCCWRRKHTDTLAPACPSLCQNLEQVFSLWNLLFYFRTALYRCMNYYFSNSAGGIWQLRTATFLIYSGYT